MISYIEVISRLEPRDGRSMSQKNEGLLASVSGKTEPGVWRYGMKGGREN